MSLNFSMRVMACLSTMILASSLAAGEATPSNAGSTPAKPAKKGDAGKAPAKVYPTMGSLERLDPALDALIPAGAQIEKLAGGFEWAEGPVWVRRSKTLLFSDVPRNVIFEWQPGVGTRDYLYHSGYTGGKNRAGEPGSNGLTLDDQGRLVMCMHGDRLIGRMEPDGKFTVLADYYLNRRLNSPNDLVFKSNGDLYFTDPPYGLEKGQDDPEKELLFNGVYLRRRSGEVVLLTRELIFPNGVALSPDEKTLYVAVSDPAKPVIMAYPIKSDGTLELGVIFFDAAPLVAGRKGLPDGLKIDTQGNLFATGPGGVLVLNSHGKHLGTINTGEATANCAWGDDGSTLYITADSFLCRIKTSTKGRIP